MEPNEHLNLMVLGKKRAGKSSTANTILGREAFTLKKSWNSVTDKVPDESGSVCGFQVTVYDTPGFCDPELKEDDIQQIIKNILQRCETGPCVFLLVIRADSFTEEERKTVEKIEELLGEKRLNNAWIIFTRGDELQNDKKTINEFLDENKGLKTLIEMYDQRYCVFNNKKKGSSDQARMLLVNILQRTLGVKDGGRLTRQIPDNQDQNQDQDDPVSSPSFRRIVLLGKTGVGKSAAGNIILGKNAFRSEQSTSSVTRDCSKELTTVSGRSVSVVDTPGLFDTFLSPKQLMIEIARSVYESSPGPHAFLIVFPVTIRFTDQEQQIAEQIEMMFGQEVLKYSIILFTHGDLFAGQNLEEHINKSCALRHLVQQCGGRFHIFSNKDENNRKQVNDLLQKIDTMIEQNGGGHYSNQMYKDAQRFRQEEEKVRQREEEKRKQRQEELQGKLEEKENELKVLKKTNIESTKSLYGFKGFFSMYEPNLRISAVAVAGNNHTGEFIGGVLGGILGGALGMRQGLSGAVAGATGGAITVVKLVQAFK